MRRRRGGEAQVTSCLLYNMEPATALLALGLYLFGPRPKLFQPKPDMKAVAAAQAQVETAKAERAKAEATLSDPGIDGC